MNIFVFLSSAGLLWFCCFLFVVHAISRGEAFRHRQDSNDLEPEAATARTLIKRGSSS